MTMKTQRQQTGVMLLEVMIGMLLFLIGILGVMGLQAVSMKNTVDAKYRTEATYLANQIVARMWADPSNLASYAIPAESECPDPPTNDAERWICAVKEALPGASGLLAPTIVLNGGTVTITIQWRKNANESVHNHTVVTYISAT